jgi:acyl carrier protein
MENFKEILNKVSAIVADVAECEVEDVQAESSLPNDLGIDSLMGLEILVRVEKEFGVKLGEEQIMLMDTPHNITQLILQTPAMVAA